MANKNGKLFKKMSTNQISCLAYDIGQDYYTFVREKQFDGYNQCIITSDIMIKIIERFVLQGNVNINSIEFMEEDSLLLDEIDNILNLMKTNSAYWEILKKKLEFISQNDSIDIKKVNFKSLKGTGYLFTIQVNGVIVIAENEFNNMAKTISKILEGCVK